MEKKPLDCKFGLTIKCPHWDKPEMDRLFTKYKYDNPTESDFIAADSICQGCKSFEAFPHTTVVSAILGLMIQPENPPHLFPPDEFVAIDYALVPGS